MVHLIGHVTNEMRDDVAYFDITLVMFISVERLRCVEESEGTLALRPTHCDCRPATRRSASARDDGRQYYLDL